VLLFLRQVVVLGEDPPGPDVLGVFALRAHYDGIEWH
jgi:hypothetical protein